MGRGEWEGVHVIIIVIIISSQCVHSAPRGKRCCWSGRWSQCRLVTRTAGRWHKRKPRRRSGGSRRMRSCWKPSPRAAASGESCERPARSMRGKEGGRGRRWGERSEVGAGRRKEMTDRPSTSFKKFLIDLNIHKLLNCGSLKCLNSSTSKEKKTQKRCWLLSLGHWDILPKAGNSWKAVGAHQCLTDSLSVLNKIKQLVIKLDVRWNVNLLLFRTNHLLLSCFLKGLETLIQCESMWYVLSSGFNHRDACENRGSTLKKEKKFKNHRERPHLVVIFCPRSNYLNAFTLKVSLLHF